MNEADAQVSPIWLDSVRSGIAGKLSSQVRRGAGLKLLRLLNMLLESLMIDWGSLCTRSAGLLSRNRLDNIGDNSFIFYSLNDCVAV